MLTEPVFISVISITHERAAAGPLAQQDGCGRWDEACWNPIPMLTPSYAHCYGHGRCSLVEQE